MNRLEDELRQKHPEAARLADGGKSRAKAIWFACRACVGGSTREARACQERWCFLWPYRPGAKRGEFEPEPGPEDQEDIGAP